MPVRHFDGVNDRIKFDLGGCDITGAFTIAALIRPATITSGTFKAVQAAMTAGGVANGYSLGHSSKQAVLFTGETTQFSGTPFIEFDNLWLLYVISKAAGSVKPRWHAKVWEEGEPSPWIEHDGSANFPDAASVAGGFLYVGDDGENDFCEFDVAALARWNSKLSEEQKKSLSTLALTDWSILSPTGFWLFNQDSVAEPVEDLSGNGADESERTDTSVLKEEPPIPYENPPSEPTNSRWDFDGNTNDSVGANDGSAVSSPKYGETLVDTEPAGKAIVLNGSSQWVEIPDHASLRLNGDFWFTVWMERGSETGRQEMLRKGPEYSFFMNEGDGLQVAWTDLSGKTQGTLTASKITAGHRYRLDAVYDENLEEVYLFVNGRLIKIDPATAPPRIGESPLSIGANGPDEERFWKGRLDKVRIRSEAPTPETILAEYREESILLLEDGFESGSLASYIETLEGEGSETAIVSADPVAFEGTNCLRSVIEPEGIRAEVVPRHTFFSEGDAIYTRFRVRFKEGFPSDPWGALVWQLRDEGDGSPVVALYVIDGEWSIRGGPATELAFTVYWNGPAIETERWYDVVIYVDCKEDAEKGEVRFWLDEMEQELEVSKGKTAFGAAYPKFGHYRNDEIEVQGVVGHDNLWISREAPSFGEEESEEEQEEEETETEPPPTKGGAFAPTIPKLRVPLRLEGGRLGVCEQDSQENVAACVYAVLAYERGSRIEDVDYGVEDPSFAQFPFDVSEWLEQIATYEPRAEVQTEQEIEDTLAAILVEVGLGP